MTTAPAARLPRSVLAELVAWARVGYPNESCGILAGSRPHAGGGAATRFFPLSNAHASPYRYLIDPMEQYRTLMAIEDAAEALWGVFHSHVASPAEPSPTDIGQAAFPDGPSTFPGVRYLICSLADAEKPVVRAWIIEGGSAQEVPLLVE